MSLEFVAGAMFMLGVVLIGAWLRDRWRYRLASSPRLPSMAALRVDADLSLTEEPRPGRGDADA